MKKAPIWTEVATVESDSEQGKMHTISRHVNGKLGCTCTSYRFARGDDKTCKHIRALNLGSVSHGWIPHATGEQVHVKTNDGERFLVRRSISFGSIDAAPSVTLPAQAGVTLSRATAEKLLDLVLDSQNVISLRSKRARLQAMAQDIREALR